MMKKDDLIRENHELRSKLELAQVWMQREVVDSLARIEQEQSRKNARIAMKNIFETEGIDILTRKIVARFGDSLEYAPKYTMERLMDAEIYWSTLQQYPQMDALPIIIAYQKILDAWVEESLVVPWRRQYKGTIHSETKISIERDVVHIIEKKHTLSLGRLYQILSLIRNNARLPLGVSPLVDFWNQHFPNILSLLLSDEFFSPFSDLMELEIFTKKRHEKKVKFRDAEMTRDTLIGTEDFDGILLMIFTK